MILDCHIHHNEICDTPELFAQKRRQAGVSGGILFSREPASFQNQKARPGESEEAVSVEVQRHQAAQLRFPLLFSPGLRCRGYLFNFK